MPEITGESDESLSQGSGNRRAARSHQSLPVLPRDVRPFFGAAGGGGVGSFGSTNSLATNNHTTTDEKSRAPSGRLSSFSFRPKHQASQAKLKKNEPVDTTPLVLPEELRKVMESLVEMLNGHEELSARL